MIAQARITSDTGASVHLASEVVEVTGSDLPQVRERVKDVFIRAAKAEDADLDVVIVECDALHHLRVEPSGRITTREVDDRPVYGPDLEEPLVPGAAEQSAGEPADGAATGPAHRHRGGRRRAAVRPQASPSPLSAASAPTAASAPSAPSAPTAASAPSAPSALSALSAPSAPSASPADPDPEQPGADGSPAAPATAAPTAPAGPSQTADAEAPSAADADEARGGQGMPSKKPLPSRIPPGSDGRPTLQDLQSSTQRPQKVRAQRGLPGLITRLTGGLISPRPNRRERFETERLERIRRPLEGPRNIVVVNLKGGAHKTTASLMIAATLGVVRGGNVLAWDNNETRGTLGWRGIPTDHHRTAVDLLRSIDALQAPTASNSDLDPFVRPQGEMRFDILASDEDPGSMASIDAAAFAALDSALSRFYRLKVIDTGNNVRASNWLAAVKSADQLVIISTVREDTFNAAAWMIDELRATGLAEQVEHAVTVLSHSAKGKFDPSLRSRLLAHFGAHTRAVTEVPFEQHFVDGTHLDWSKVSPATKNAWMDATALIIDGL